MRLELTRRADYAIRTMMYLASQGRGRRVPAPAIAESMDVPKRFLPQIMQDLVRARLVEATPGRGGGYRMTRAPSEVSILEIIEAVEDVDRRSTCVLSSTSCDPASPCGVHELFVSAQDALLERLADATVLDATRAGSSSSVMPQQLDL